MSKAFQQTLSQAKELSPEEQLALIALLSRYLAMDQLSTMGELAELDYLPEQDEAILLARIEAYEKGKSKTLSGVNFRANMRKKYGH